MTAAVQPYELSHDTIWPRDEQHRYRLYARLGDTLTVLSAAPDMQGIGLALRTLHEDAKTAGATLTDLGQTGILDAVEHEWIVLPYNRQEA